MRELQNAFTFANELADTARKLVQEQLDHAPLPFENKDDSSPVTILDRAVEKKLREMIEARYPDHGILGEEYTSKQSSSEYVWVLDPIDGTKAFICGLPIFGTLIALTKNTLPILGIIEHPASNERWAGLEGQASTYNGTAIRCRPCPVLADAIVSLGNPESLSSSELTAFTALRKKTRWGIYGGSCYIYGRLAMGRLDISIDSGLDPFDYCALDVVIRGAGGQISDWEGRPLSLTSGRRIVASGDADLHRQALILLENS